MEICKKSGADALNVDVLDTALALGRRGILLSVGRGLDVRGAVVGGSRGGSGSGRGDRSRRLRLRRLGRRASGSTVPDLRAGEGEVLSTVVDAEVGVGVLVAVRGGELDQGAGSAVSAASNLDLNARDIVFRLVDVRPVDTTAKFRLVAPQ